MHAAHPGWLLPNCWSVLLRLICARHEREDVPRDSGGVQRGRWSRHRLRRDVRPFQWKARPSASDCGCSSFDDSSCRFSHGHDPAWWTGHSRLGTFESHRTLSFVAEFAGGLRRAGNASPSRHRCGSARSQSGSEGWSGRPDPEVNDDYSPRCSGLVLSKSASRS